MKKLVLVAAFAILASMAANASAGTIYTFETTGVMSGFPVSGTATFDVSTTGLTLRLENTTVGVHEIAQILDGFWWTMDQTPFLTEASTTLLPGTELVNCYESTAPCPSTTTSLKYWPLGAQPSPYTLKSGNLFQLLPFGLVDADYSSPGTKGKLSNNQHNPLIVGPLELQFIYGTLANPLTLESAPVITSATFQWGTVLGTTTDGSCTEGNGCETDQVPEPASLLMLGSGLLGVGFVARRRMK